MQYAFGFGRLHAYVIDLASFTSAVHLVRPCVLPEVFEHQTRCCQSCSVQPVREHMASMVTLTMPVIPDDVTIVRRELLAQHGVRIDPQDKRALLVPNPSQHGLDLHQLRLEDVVWKSA
eukprot:8040907-Pyramimonas_sp.AAC.1